MFVYDFQRPLATSHATLPVVCVLTLLVWIVAPDVDASSLFSGNDYGMWTLIPPMLLQGLAGKIAGLLLGAVCVYCMAELNNGNVLLRISSRMLSSTLALLLMVGIAPYMAQPGLVLMLLTLLSFFPLFANYQIISPMLTLTAFLLLSVSSLVFPKMLYLVPVYWCMQGYLRSFSFRCFVASLFGIVLPYWFYAGIAISFGWTEQFLAHISAFVPAMPLDYSHLTVNQWAVAAFVLLLFGIGAVNFFVHSFLDKTRTRSLYKATTVHGVGVVLFMALQPQYIVTLVPVLMADAAITFGHFFALTSNRFTRILNIFLLLAAVALTIWNH